MSGVVLVTGAAGGLGRQVLPALRRAGWTTRCLVHRRHVDGADEVVLGDLSSAADLSEAVHGVDAILHMAAITHARSEEAYTRVNVEGTRRLVQAASAARVARFLHVSTRAISPDGGAYSRSKRRAEEIVEAHAEGHVIVRLPEVYGLGRTEGVDQILERARRGATILLVGEGDDEICPVHVQDVITPLATALRRSFPGERTYTLAGDCMSVRTFAVTCRDAFGGRSRILRVPEPMVRVASAVSRLVPLPLVPDQLERLRAPKATASPGARVELDFQPRPLAVHLARLASRHV